MGLYKDPSALFGHIAGLDFVFFFWGGRGIKTQEAMGSSIFTTVPKDHVLVL